MKNATTILCNAHVYLYGQFWNMNHGSGDYKSYTDAVKILQDAMLEIEEEEYAKGSN